MNLRSHLRGRDSTTVSGRSRRVGLPVGILVLLVAFILLPASEASASPLAVSSMTTTNVQAFMTLYGYVDNSPSGTDIAHPCIHSQAGGTGTFADPITFATDVNELPWCQVIYVPYMERYFIHEDECSQCDANWTSLHLYRFDMWAGGNAASRYQPERAALVRCESNWTRANSVNDPGNPTILVHPPPNLPVTTSPIFSPPTTCWQPITVTNPGSQTTDLRASPVSLQVSATDTTPGETLEYHAVGLPSGLSIDSLSGMISGIPTMRQRTSVTVTVSDAQNSASIKFRWIVKSVRKIHTVAATFQSGGSVLAGTQCPVFPADSVWNTPITGLSVNADSATWLTSMHASTALLHPDYGPSQRKNKPYGLPWQVISPWQPPTSIKFTYADQSDPGPYPLSASTPIEAGSDRHAIMVNPASCTLYELFDTHYHARKESTAGSGAIWSLESDALRPAGWTSADAAGLPILPGLINFDEVASGSMDHAIRFTAACTQQSYLWPARHEAGQADASCPPMGARFRLSAGFSLPAAQCSSMCQTVITTMKNYGLILADNGSNWFFQGTADTRWTAVEVDQLKQIPASAFVAVDESCLMVSANSGQAHQPGSSGYSESCG